MTAPARFRRITSRTKVTAPCVLARAANSVCRSGWRGELINTDEELRLLIDHYTHFLPIEFPEVRG